MGGKKGRSASGKKKGSGVKSHPGFNSGKGNFVDRNNSQTTPVLPEEKTTEEKPSDSNNNPDKAVEKTPAVTLETPKASQDTNNNKSTPAVAKTFSTSPLQPPSKSLDSFVGDSSVSVSAEKPSLSLEGYKHPLESTWTFWYYNDKRDKSWEENLVELGDFSYAEDFWALVNHMELVSKARIGTDFLVFKRGVKPMWEDPRNKDGGRWMIKLNTNERVDDKCHKAWIDLLLTMIGNTVDCSGITGAVFNCRAKLDKLSIWLETSNHRRDEKYIMSVGQAFQSIVHDSANGLNFPLPLTFEAHADTQIKSGSDARVIFKLHNFQNPPSQGRGSYNSPSQFGKRNYR